MKTRRRDKYFCEFDFLPSSYRSTHLLHSDIYFSSLKNGWSPRTTYFENHKRKFSALWCVVWPCVCMCVRVRWRRHVGRSSGVKRELRVSASSCAWREVRKLHVCAVKAWKTRRKRPFSLIYREKVFNFSAEFVSEAATEAAPVSSFSARCVCGRNTGNNGEGEDQQHPY